MSTHEEQYIGAVFLDNDIVVKCPVETRHFGDARLAHLHAAIVRMIGRGERADMVSVAMEHSKAPWWPGAAYVSELTDSIPTLALAKSLAQSITRSGRQRAFKLWLAKTSKLVEESPDNALERAQAELMRLFSDESSAPFVHFYDEARRWFGGLLDGTGDTIRVKTGDPELDENWVLDCGGFHIIAGRPSMGKSSLALWLIEQIALQGIGVLLFTLEMTNAQLITKQVSSWIRIPQFTLLSRFKNYEKEISDTLYEHKDLPIYLQDLGRQTIEQIAMRSHFAKQHKNIGVVVVDYIQLVRSAGKFQSREQEVAHISGSLKALAKSINCPVIALSQLSREVERREGKRPTLADLRESGSLEQDADTVALIYRPEYYAVIERKPIPEEQKGVIELNIAKQRKIGPRTIVGKYRADVNDFGWGEQSEQQQSFITPRASWFETEEARE